MGLSTSPATSTGGVSRTSKDLSFVLILAVGRSGSTLVQGILNSFPGYYIGGENGNAAYRLFEMHSELLRRKEQFDGDERLASPTHPWFGLHNIDDDHFFSTAREFFLRGILLPDINATTVGYKEIRYMSPMVPDLDSFLVFLRKLFPGVKLVVNVRDPRQVAQSAWWARRSGDVVAMIDAEQTRILEASKRSQAPTYLLRYDEIIASTEALEPLCDFLGQVYSYDNLTAVLSRRHSV